MPRPIKTETIDEMLKRRQQIDAAIESARAKQREHQRGKVLQQKIVLGGAVMAWLEGNPDEAQAFRLRIGQYVTRKQDKDALMEYFAPPASAPESA